jgi:AcrR family transcriptional regulator
MPKQGQQIDLKRRKPMQARAQSKVAAIFEATAQILEKDGRAALNTNRIAERAGVSVSTIYQYFSNKEAILIALARREMDFHRSTVVDAVTKAAQHDDPERDRLVLRALINASGKRRKTRRIAQETLLVSGYEGELAKTAQDVGTLLAEKPEALPPHDRALSPQALFVLTRAVHGVMGAVLREEAPFQSPQQLEDELTKLVRGFVAAQSAADATDTRVASNASTEVHA